MTDNPQQPYGAGTPDQPGQQPYQQPGQPYQQPGQQPYGGAPQQGSKFGTDAYNPGAVGQEMSEPPKWALLKKLTLASFAVYVISSIVSFVSAGNRDILEETMRSQATTSGLSEQQIQDAIAFGAGAAYLMSAISLIIAIVLYLVVFFGLRKGKNWARILGIVMAIIGSLSVLYSLTQLGVGMEVAPGITITSIVIGIVFVVVNIWWLLTAFSKESAAYAKARSAN
ncbi:hypothetical protein [Citricoccus sp. GCM10030269]|uniref:hypothetical protein n=1 Tax=Citricoccus sp. GCM10030269 TaxID=3273388 RepID=UPI003620A707